MNAPAKLPWNVAADHLTAAMGEISRASAVLRDGSDFVREQAPEYYKANRLWLEAEELLGELRRNAAEAAK